MKINLPLHRNSIIWLTLAGISVAISGFLGFRYISIRNNLLHKAEENARHETEKASRKLNDFIDVLKPIAQNLAEEIGSKSLTRQQIVELIIKKKPIEVSGLGVAFLPNKFGPETKLFAPYYFEANGKNSMLFLEDIYDYTKERTTWFQRPIKKGADFIEPYYGKASKTILAEYSVPIYRTSTHGKKQIIGIVYANQSVEHLNHILATLFLNQTGYWSIITKKGNFLAHPQEQLVHRQTSIFDLAKKLGNASLAEAGNKIIKKERVFLEYNNEITGAPSWLLSEPIEGTNWSIVGVFDKSELNISSDILRHNLIFPSLSLLLFIIMLTFFIFSLFTINHPAKWWIASGIISVALIMQVIWVWYATFNYPNFQKETFYTVKNKAELHAYLKKEAALFRYGKKTNEKGALAETTEKEPKQNTLLAQANEALIYGYQDARYIPTGIFVNNISFVASNQIQISAYIWQRFTDGMHDTVSHGFLLPQSMDTKITKISSIKEGNVETILWEVQAKLNQLLTYKSYPFDAKNLRIQIWHQSGKKNIILVPDLDSYQLINPRSLPGINSDTFIPEWNIVGSKFGYKKINYSSNFGFYSVGPFGVYNSIDKSEVPEMFFELLITRKLIDTLVSDLLPIAVIAVLLFVILLTSTAQTQSSVISYCASVFVATVFAQIRFRSKIPQAQIVYFESFYFLMYAMILMMLLITISYQFQFKISFLKHRDTITAKILYWPILFSWLSFITLWYLY